MLESTPLPVTQRLDIAFLGLGVMGYPMAGHLAKAGHRVHVYNRDSHKTDAWMKEYSSFNVQGALSPAHAVATAKIVFTCVGNDVALRDVCLGALQPDGTRLKTGAFHAMKPGAILVDHSTTSVEVAKELNEIAFSLGLAFVDAPVSGGQAGAQNGVLTVMCGATAEVFNLIQPVAMAFSRAVTLMGPVGAGQKTKMVNQICIAGLVQALSEGLAFAQKAGLDANLVLDVISKGAAQSWQMENRGKTMVADKFDFGFAVDLMRKDLGLVLAEAEKIGANVECTQLVDKFYSEVQAMGGNRWDTSSLIKRLK
jgi:3-hydroxyisobutyrate dehydrogenase-like beta-hydroxyacid dehydrogenase